MPKFSKLNKKPPRNKLKLGRWKLPLMLFIVSFGLLFRIYQLKNIPPGFFADEASIGYNAFTLVNFGSDEAGNKMPLLFQNFGNFYRPGVSIYIAALFVKPLGLSEGVVRLPTALIGTLTVVFIYLVTKLLFDSEVIAFISAISLAISPWHIHMSRIGQEFVYLPFFILVSLFMFLLGLKRKSNIILPVSFILFGISLYTYVPAYFLIPLLMLGLLLVYRKELLTVKKGLFCGLVLSTIISLPLLAGIPAGKTFSRYSQLSTTNGNKPLEEIVSKTVKTYADHFSINFLFKDGDIGYPGHFITRFSVRGLGELYWIQMPLIILGIIYLIKKHSKNSAVVALFLLIYPLPSSLVPFADGGGPFAMRSILGVIPFQMLTGVGTFYAIQVAKSTMIRYLLVGLLVIILIFSLIDFLHKYYFEYPIYASNFWGWQMGPKEIMKTFLSEKNNYEQLIFSYSFNAPYIFLKFYDPNNVCANKCIIGDFSKLDLTKKQLFSVAYDKMAQIPKDLSFVPIKTIYYPDNQPAFFIGEFKIHFRSGESYNIPHGL